MANTADYKHIEGYTDQVYSKVFEYDFANDTGAQGTYVMGLFKHKAIVLRSKVFVETACGSVGSATVAIGTSVADPDAFMDATSGAVASLIDDFLHVESTSENLVVAADETLDLIIATADLNAGKIKVILECLNVA